MQEALRNKRALSRGLLVNLEHVTAATTAATKATTEVVCMPPFHPSSVSAKVEELETLILT